MRWATSLTALGTFVLAQPVWPCDLADTAMAERVLGSEVLDTTVEPESFCNFISTTLSALLEVAEAIAATLD
jgi:hypothetical protein